MLFFTFIKGGVTPLTGPPNLNGFSLIIRGGGGKSLLTNVDKKMFFLNEGFPRSSQSMHCFLEFVLIALSLPHHPLVLDFIEVDKVILVQSLISLFQAERVQLWEDGQLWVLPSRCFSLHDPANHDEPGPDMRAMFLDVLKAANNSAVARLWHFSKNIHIFFNFKSSWKFHSYKLL